MERSTVIFFSVTALACVTKFAATAILLWLAITALMPGRIFVLAITASAFEIFAFVTLLTTIGIFLGRVSRALLLWSWIPGALSCLAGTILSLITLAMTIHFADEKILKEYSYSFTRRWAIAGVTIASVGLIPQAAFYVLVRPRSEPGILEPLDCLEGRESPPRSLFRQSITMHMTSLGPTSPKFYRAQSVPGSPSLSAMSGSPRSSFRSSTNQTLRPMSSKTRLLLHTSFVSKDSRNVQSETIEEPIREHDGFENWDTSGVEDNYASPFGSKTKMSRLETIPGSRPVSPARPLDGPFLDDDVRDIAPEDLPLPESPVQSPMSAMSPGSETSSLHSMQRKTIRRANSNANDQSFIHPLFRTESPVPPPLTSPGTVIHASPYAGQVMSAEDMALSPKIFPYNGSRPGTPNLASPARSRAGSMRSFRLNNSTSPIDQAYDRGPSQLSGTYSPIPNDRGPSQLSGTYSPHPND